MDAVNLHIYQSTFRHESRILKITKTLSDYGVFDKILILARWEPGLAKREDLDQRRQVWRISSRSPQRLGRLGKLLALIEWSIRIIWLVRKMPVSCVNCHSLLVLPLCATIAGLKRSRLIYDTHELETETMSASGMRRWFFKWIERSLIARADEVVVVGDRIADWYRRNYQLSNVHVIKNVPYRQLVVPRPASNLREFAGLKKTDILFLYQGLIDSGRGIELLLNAFRDAPQDRHIVFMGYGSLVDSVKSFEQRHSNIHFHPAVPPQELPRYTSSADVGLSVIENTSLSYYYCVPNKVFEYLTCGVPMIVSDFPEMAALVDAHNCGWKVPVSQSEINRIVARITKSEIESKREATLESRLRFGWEDEEPALLSVYHSICKDGHAAAA